jgi:hypothetical protein
VTRESQDSRSAQPGAACMDYVTAFRAYGEFSGILVGFVVASLAVVFSIAPTSGHTDTLDRVVLQLCLGLLAGTVTALSLMTLAAYPASDAHRGAAPLLVVPAAVCALTVMAAFEELATALLPDVSGFLLFIVTCLAGLAILPSSFALPCGWAGHLAAAFCAWLLFILILLGKEGSGVWTPSLRCVAAIALAISVVVALLAAVAFLEVAHPKIYKVLPWSKSAEQITTWALLALASAALLLALLPAA